MKTGPLRCITLACSLYLLNSCQEPPPVQPIVASADYKKGETLLGQKNDSAFYYFNKVATTSKDSLEIANSYNNMSGVQSDAGDHFGAQESLLTSLKYLDENKEKDYFCLSSDFNELGSTNLNLKNYEAAIHYYQLAVKFARNEAFKLVFLNNLALCYQRTGQYEKAIALYQDIIGKVGDDRKTLARVRTNLATTRWLQDSSYPAAPELWQALGVRKAEKDDWGLNSSYGHLADFYMHSKPDSALFYTEQLYKIALQLKSPDDELEALQKLIPLSPATAAKFYFTRYQQLNDSIQTARNNAKNQFALIRYEAAKNKADLLRLQTENAENKLQLLWQRIMLFGILVVLAFVVMLGVSLYRKRQQKMKFEAEKAIRESRLRTSQKVHDVVAGGLYRIMSEIEHNPTVDLVQIQDHLESLYEKSRDISYETTDQPERPMDEWVAELLLSFASEARAIFIRGNEPSLWNGLNKSSRREVEHILLELMVNMKKHSLAKNVVLKFHRQDNNIHLEYSDDGRGLSPDVELGNGLISTVNRIKALGGTIIFVPKLTRGLAIQLYFATNHA